MDTELKRVIAARLDRESDMDLWPANLTPEQAIHVARIVAQAFETHLRDTEPYAQRTIAALRDAAAQFYREEQD